MALAGPIVWLRDSITLNSIGFCVVNSDPPSMYDDDDDDERTLSSFLGGERVRPENVSLLDVLVSINPLVCGDLRPSVRPSALG